MSATFVLLRARQDISFLDDVKVVGLFADRDAVLAKIERIRQANKQYPLVETGPNSWRVGPDCDEGFFGHKPIELRVVEVAA